MKVYKPSWPMKDNFFKCWNCRKKQDISELASIPFAFKAGLTVMSYTFNMLIHPDRTCKSCEGQALFLGFLGWLFAMAIAVVAIFSLVHWINGG